MAKKTKFKRIPGMIYTLRVKVGDVLVATDDVWCAHKQAYIKKGTEIKIEHMDDLIWLPSIYLFKKKT